MESSHYAFLYKAEKEHWWYASRRKIVCDLILANTKAKDVKILDVGCGTGELLKELQKFGIPTGVDISPQAVNFCKKRGIKRVILGELPNLPFPKNSFSLILCLDVLEHVKNDREAIKNLYETLKPDGILILFVPTFNFLWGKSDDLGHHFRRYRLGELIIKLRENKFSILRHSYFNFFLFPPILFTRWFINIFKIKIVSENTLGNYVVNNILRTIFLLESTLLKKIDFPFGVSGFIVAKKESKNS